MIRYSILRITSSLTAIFLFAEKSFEKNNRNHLKMAMFAILRKKFKIGFFDFLVKCNIICKPQSHEF